MRFKDYIELIDDIRSMLLVIEAFSEEGTDGWYQLQEWKEKYLNIGVGEKGK